jgi:hypothetical protein
MQQTRGGEGPSLTNGCVNCSRKHIAPAVHTQRYFLNTEIRKILLRLGRVAGNSHAGSPRSLDPGRHLTISEFILRLIRLIEHGHKHSEDDAPIVISMDRADYIDAVALTDGASFIVEGYFTSTYRSRSSRRQFCFQFA